MKRSIVLLIMILAALGLFAQTEPGSDVLTNKRGIAIKPVSGDFAVGIDATPFFRWAGNLFSNNNPYSPSFGFTAQAPGSIFGKYKVSSTTTYRAVLLIGYTSETDKSPNSTDPDMVDKTSASALTIGLTGGIEKHRDVFGRLSGYYGAQAGFSVDPYYDSGNGYYGKLDYKDGNDSANDYKESGGSTICIMAGGFVGVEFYIAPRIALSGEFAYSLSFYTQGKRTGKPATGSETTVSYGGGGFEFMPTSSGSLVVLFYF